ncbi:hypothetical protein [Planobispora rosea]|uniref:hypothetical protein n=1 Tax=Planobispora rosea TaxID=35762 RepID=UPI00083A4995|nr:hypothetical protein [Planobispora rosea]
MAALMAVRDAEMARLRSDLETAHEVIRTLSEHQHVTSGQIDLAQQAAECERGIAEGWQARAVQAETELERIRTALNTLHPIVEHACWYPCKRHSLVEEAATLRSCPNCIAEPVLGCQCGDDDCPIRAILNTLETPNA